MLFAAAVCIAFAAPAAPITPESVAQVLDPIFAKCSPEGTPGASVSVVFNGQTVLTKGYGLADPEKNVAVDPNSSLFRAASISKLFTATAVMQLVEQGKINLDADVNGYLKEPLVPKAFLGQPVTMRNLLQHAAGLDDEFLYMARQNPEDVPPLADYLRTGLPERVFPPGHFVSYSNHGLALAGLVVEQVSGEPFVQYVHDHIFAPLAMEHSYFDLVPDANTPLAVGHWRGLFGGPLQTAGYDYPCTIPASTLCTTSADMAHFMICHLANGLYDGKKLLRPDSAITMQTTGSQGVPGVALGFFERWINGRRCLAHTGLIWGYASQLLLYPEEKFGVYITLNSEDGGLYDEASNALMDTFFPETAPRDVYKLPTLPLDLDARAINDGIEKILCGTYRHTRYPRNSFLKFGLLVSGRVSEMEITPGPRPGVWVQRPVGGKGQSLLYGYRSYRYGKPGATEDEAILVPGPPAVTLDKSYGVNRIESSLGPQPSSAFVYRSNAYERISPWETTHFLTRVAGLCLLVLLLWPVGRPFVKFAIRKRVDELYPLTDALLRTTHVFAGALLLFAVGIAAILTTLNPLAVAYGPPLALWPVLCLPLVAIFAGLFAWAGLLTVLRFSRGHWAERIHLLLTLGAGTVLLVVLNYWKLVGFHMG